MQPVPPEFLLVDRQLYLDAFKRVRRTNYSPAGTISPEGLQQTYEVLRQHNRAVRRAPVQFLNGTYTNKFVNKAFEQYH